MAEPKWELTLSTTEKNNIGLIKPRKNNENSEVMKVKLIKNSKPYDLTALKVFFVTHFSGRNNLKVPVQKEATVINAEEGIFEFTLDQDCMQKAGRQEAYFEIYDYDKFLDTTQNFTYEIISSSRNMKADFTPWIDTWAEAEEMLKEGTAKVLTDKTEKLELQKANVVDVNEQLRRQKQETDNKLEKKTNNTTFVAITSDMQRQIESTQSGMIGEYDSEAQLKAEYPQGAKGYAVVWLNENGKKVGYTYTYKNKSWVKGNVWNGMGIEDKSVTLDKLESLTPYSLIPTNKRDWNTFRITTTQNQPFSYGSQGFTLQNDNDYFYKSASDFGLSFRVKVKKGQSIKMIGNSNQYVTCVRFDENMICLGGTGWQFKEFEYTCDFDGYAYFVIKNANGTALTLNDIENLTVKVYSKDIRSNRVYDENAFNGFSWEQGMYNFVVGQKLGAFSYSNFRQTALVKVNPSTEYEFKNNFQIGNYKYKFALFLLGKDRQCLHGTGWVAGKESFKIRTTPETYELMFMYQRETDQLIDNKHMIHVNPTLFLNGQTLIGINELKESEKDDKNIFKQCLVDDWKQRNVSAVIGKNTPTVFSDKRLSVKLQLKKNTTYLFDLNAPYDYKLNFVHADNNNISLFDSFWHWGEYRYQTGDTDEILYIVVANREDSKVINVEEIIQFSPSLTVIEPYNTTLDTTTSKKIIMHRGAMQEAPENTIEALKIVAQKGLWASEMDVQYTKDKVAIIHHDDTVDRMTDGAGKISEMTLEQIKALTINAGPNIEKYPNLKIPTLEEMIIAAKRYGVMPVLDSGTPLATREGTEMLVADLKRLGIEQKCIVLTQGVTNSCNFRFFNKVTPIIVQYSGNFSTILGLSLQQGSAVEVARLYRWREAYCGGWNFERVGTTDDMLQALWLEGHKKQLQFYAITNDKSQMENWFSRGCDFISSDDLEILDY